MKEYKTITRVAGPLIFVEKTEPIGYADIVKIALPNGEIKNGQVLDTSDDIVVVQVFEGTAGIDIDTRVKFLGDTLKLNVAKDMLGRVLSGSGKPIDGGPEIIPEKRLDIIGAAINPYARSSPHDFIQTGISTIDAMNTLVRGQKLPIFSGSGLPHNEIALQIARQAKVVGRQENFVVVFAAMGITNEEAQYFINDFRQTGALERSVVFLNLANDPAVERLVTPRMALTAAEYFAYEHDAHVLVILTDLTNYCESLREIGAAREEIPGRRGYPGYMYSVDGSRRVIVKDPAGILKVIEINKLFDILSLENEKILDTFEERIKVNGWQALSADTNGKSSFSPIKQILRHKYNGKLCKITTQMGETIVTPNHSIFTLRNGKIQLCEAGKIGKEDLVVHINKIPPIQETNYKWKGRDAWKVYLSTKLKVKHSVLDDVIGCQVSKVEFVETTEEYVYDLSVEGNQNFVDACGNMLLHNTDLATLYERAGVIKGKKGSITQFPILTMVGDDITHPIPDLTGYITEGQIVLARELHRKGVYPSIDVLPSLSRLMNLGIGPTRTREDHKQVSDQLYAVYAEGRDLRGLVAIVGEEALSERDKKFLKFAAEFEDKFVRQKRDEDRSIAETLDLGWKLLGLLPENELIRISPELRKKYYKQQ